MEKKIFNLYANVTIGIYTRVEAETLEEAIEIAQERSIEKSEWNNEEQVTRIAASAIHGYRSLFGFDKKHKPELVLA